MQNNQMKSLIAVLCRHHAYSTPKHILETCIHQQQLHHLGRRSQCPSERHNPHHLTSLVRNWACCAGLLRPRTTEESSSRGERTGPAWPDNLRYPRGVLSRTQPTTWNRIPPICLLAVQAASKFRRPDRVLSHQSAEDPTAKFWPARVRHHEFRASDGVGVSDRGELFPDHSGTGVGSSKSAKHVL
jgi:hypothetical protein